MDDTSPQAAELYINLHRTMTQAERFARIFELCDIQVARQQSSVRAMYLDAGEKEVFLRVAAQRLDRATMIKAYD